MRVRNAIRKVADNCVFNEVLETYTPVSLVLKSDGFALFPQMPNTRHLANIKDVLLKELLDVHSPGNI